MSNFCNNELYLICPFDSIPLWKGDFKLVKVDFEKQISNLFKGDLCCKNLNFNVYHYLDSFNRIEITLNYFFHCDNCPIYIQEKNDCYIVQNYCGQILFNGEIISVDSLDKELNNYYSKIEQKKTHNDSCKNVNILIQWDLNVSEKDFRSYINQIIKGYLNFANEFALKKYNKKICQLNQKELKDIRKIIPFQIIIPSYGKLKNEVK